MYNRAKSPMRNKCIDAANNYDEEYLQYISDIEFKKAKRLVVIKEIMKKRKEVVNEKES